MGSPSLTDMPNQDRRAYPPSRTSRLQKSLRRVVDAVLNAAQRSHGPDATAAYATAETEIARLRDVVHAMKHDERARAARSPDRFSVDRVSIH